MLEVKKILFALELSDIASDIAPWVNLMAEKFRAEVHLLHVVPDMADVGFPYAVVPMADMEAMLESAQKKVNDFKEAQIEEKHPTQVAIVSGDPVEQILAYIADNGISIAILGTHGRRGLSRAVFGSVADRVLRTSPVPVLIVRPHPSDDAGE